MDYESLLVTAESIGLVVREKDLQAYDGRIKGLRVAIRRDLPTDRAKACVLAEEVGHYFTSSGDLINESQEARKQERRARMWAYDLQIGLSGIVAAKTAGCKNLHETAEYLNVPPEFLVECVKCYREKYGTATKYRDYIIFFDPCLDVLTVKEAQNGW